MKDTALIVMDMQVGNFDPSFPISRGTELLAAVAELIEQARRANAPVIFIQNDGLEGGIDAPDTPGWEIHPAVFPAADEPVLRKKTPDAFHETGLSDELNELDIHRLVICGLQTEFCVDTTVRRGYILGYEMILAGDAHSTWDSSDLTAAQIIRHHNGVLGSLFAQCMPAGEVIF